MELPVLINGEEKGALRVSRDGLYTVLEAEAGGSGLVRLWLHGGGRSAYLGVMEPVPGGLTLRRRLSRRELAAFPEAMEYASDEEGGRAPEATPEESLHNEEQEERESGETEEDEAEDLHNIEPDPSPARETDARACPWPAEPPEEGLLWYRRSDGSLVSFDGISSLLAIPAELRAKSAQAAERVIEGKKYLVFRY